MAWRPGLPYLACVAMENKNAPKLHIDLDDERLLSVEYTLPHVEENLEEQREEELERYDDQILAGLVTF